MIVEPFIRRPVMAVVLSVILILVGLVALPQLGVRETPQIDPPVVTVTTTYFGADPAILETEVTEVLERELNGIAGLRTITSTSRDQTSQISLEFDLAKDLDEAANDVRDRVARARDDLPPDVEEPSVEKSEADGSAVIFVRVVGERSLLELSDIADRLVRERLETVNGVSRVDINGERRYAIRVELDAAALSARDLTVADVEAALNAGNVDAPAGRIEGTATDIAARVDAGLSTVDDFESLVVRARGGATVHLRDVARVRLGAEDERSSARSDGVPSVTLAILPQSNANIVEISDEVRARVPAILTELPEGVSLEINYDRSLPVRHSIRDVVFTLLLSAAMVVAVIWLFLRDVRATVVPAAAIVVSLIGTFAFQWALGFTLNVFTLFGLVLAIGIVVDDAIVVLENIWRHVEAGQPPLEAAIEGAREIVVPVIATTVSLVVVFLPVIFTGGATGRLFLEFGGTVAISVALSAVVALTLSPALCALLLRPRAHAADEEGLVTRAFGRTLDVVLRWPWLAFAALLASIAAGGAALWQAPREFFPIEDRNFFLVRATGPEGVGFAWMDARVRELEPALIEAVPERIAMLSRVNLARGSVPGSTNAAVYAFPLVPPDQRTRTQDEIARGVAPLLSQVTAFRAFPIEPPTIGGGFGAAALQLVVMHEDYDTLTTHLPTLMEAMRAVPGLTGVDVDLKLNRPETRVVVDREKAAAVGVSLDDLARTLQVLSTGIERDRFKRDGRQYPVMLSLGAAERSTTTTLGHLRVRLASGALVPVDTLVRFEERSAASARYHYDRAPSATISASLDGIPLGTAVERAKAAATAALPAGFHLALAGASRSFDEANTALAAIFALSLVLVYLVLAAQFDSLRDPLPILVSLPVGVAGGVGALWLVGEPLSFFAQVGLVLLVGLVAKNGILIVEFAAHLAAEGEDVWSAARRASVLRLRPIMMTSLATVGGAVPIALGFSGTSRSALGHVVVAGMAVSTVMALYATPAVWATFRRLRLPGRRVAAVVAAVGVAAPTARAEELSLTAALAEALAANPALAAARADAEGADAAVGTARGGVLPALTGTGRYQYGNSFVAGGAGVGGQPTSFANLQAVATVPLADPSGWYTVGAAARAAEASAARVRARELDLLAAVAARWLELQEAQGRQGLWETAIAFDEELARVAVDRAAAGVGLRLDVVRAEVQVGTDRLALLQADQDRATATARLIAALGRDAPAELTTPAVALFETCPADAAERPELTDARAWVAAAEATERAATWRTGPRLAAFGQAGGLTRFDGNGWLPTVAIGLDLTMGVVDGARLGQVHEARARVAAAAAVVRSIEQQIQAEVDAARAAVEAAQAAVTLARATLAWADEELALADDRWRAGAGSQVDVIQAQVRRTTLALTDLAAVIAYDRAVVDLCRATGGLARWTGR